MVSQQRRFDLLLAAMPEKILVMDIVENMPEDYPYDTLKARLQEIHTLSYQEKMNILFKSEPLGGRKPSQMYFGLLLFCIDGTVRDVPAYVPPTSAGHLADIAGGNR
jgi:hypothetical protein